MLVSRVSMEKLAAATLSGEGETARRELKPEAGKAPGAGFCEAGQPTGLTEPGDGGTRSSALISQLQLETAQCVLDWLLAALATLPCGTVILSPRSRLL